MEYDLIVVDPPWSVKKTGRRKSRPNQGRSLDYKTMAMDEIKALPIREISAKNSVLFLWATHSYLELAFGVMRSWGFRYQRTLTWDKGNGICLYGFHHRTEFVLFGYRGHIEAFPKRKAIPTIFYGKSSRHSEKPDEFYRMVECLGQRRIDVFARTKRIGWDVFGDEVEGSIILPNVDLA